MEEIQPIIQSYIVDFASNNNFLFVKGVQGDGYQTRYADITLTNNGQPYELVRESIRVILRGTKPDNKEIFNVCEIIDSNTIRVEITQQMSAIPGKGNYEISIMSTEKNKLLTSFPFFIIISPSSFDVSNLTSTNEFTLLVDKINQVDKLEDKTDQLISDQETLKVELEKTIEDSERATADSIAATTDCRNATSDLRELHKTVQEAETIRISNENVRNNNEQNRIDSELLRQQQAQDFADAEAIRVIQENERQVNTATAITNAENATQIAIHQTELMENLEDLISANEAIRQSNESERILNEDIREDFHGAMQELEDTISTNETTRQEQEEKRQSDTATAISNAEIATEAAWEVVNSLQTNLGIDDDSVTHVTTWSSNKIQTQTQEWFWRKSINNILISSDLWSNNKLYILSEIFSEDSVVDIYYNLNSFDMVAECDLRYTQGDGYLCIIATYTPYDSILIDNIMIENYYSQAEGNISSTLN